VIIASDSAEDLRDQERVHATPEHVRRVAVTKDVGVHPLRDSRSVTRLADELLDVALRERLVAPGAPVPAPGDEDPVRVGVLRPLAVDVAPQPARELRLKSHEPALVALVAAALAAAGDPQVVRLVALGDVRRTELH
jgi:hypothetical protein